MKLARIWHAVTALVVAAALLTELVLIVSRHQDLGSFLSYFTVQSNLLVAVVAVTLALRPERDGPIWRILRLDAVVAIVITGLVYHLMLASLRDLHGIEQAVDVGLHTVVPLLTLVGWLLFGPRPRITPAVIAWSMVLPTVWFCYTLVRGAIVGWYPYPFLDVPRHGYAAVIVNALLVGALFVALGLVGRFAEARLPRPLGGSGEVRSDGS